MTTPTGELAAAYVAHGWALCPIEHGQKRPRTPSWNKRERAITDPEVAAELTAGIGLLHAYSGTCCLDFDDLEKAREWFGLRGVNIDEYLQSEKCVQISSGRENRAKLLFATAAALRSVTIGHTEFRCATATGKSMQDALPPSVHPITERAYSWIGDWRDLPELPAEIRTIWESLIPAAHERVEPESTAETPEQLRHVESVIANHSPDGGYEIWLRVGMAVHYETNGSDEGIALWDRWSRSSADYDREEIEAKWRSFNAATETPVTLGSLRVATVAGDDEFKPIVLTQPERQEAAKVEELSAVMRRLPRNEEGRILAQINSVTTVLAEPVFYGQDIARDVFKDLIVLSDEGREQWRPIRDTDYTRIRNWLETAARFNPVSREMVRDAVHLVAEIHEVDTAQKWLSELKWDGKPRIDKFFPRYMGTVDAEYERAVSLYLWTALAGRVMDPGCQVDMVPILVGGQGLGKSTGVKALVPDPQFFAELSLSDTDDNNARKMRGVLVVELAELKGLHTTDLEHIKAFVTRTHEKWVPKFMEFATEFPRRCVMIGTSNEDEFLSDTENRRFLPLRTTGVDREAITRDRDQLWAEGLVRWREGGVAWAEAEKRGKAEQEQFVQADAWEGVVGQWLADNANPVTVRTEQVLLEAVGLDIRTTTRVHQLRMGKVMRRLGYEKGKVYQGAKGVRCWCKIHRKEPEPWE